MVATGSMWTKADERTPAQCPECGFVADGMSPADASAAIRSFPRRFRELLMPDRVTDQGLLRHRPSPGDWSAIEHVAHLADAFHVAANRLVRVRAVERPPLGRDGGDSFDDGPDAGLVLARLRDSCARLADEIDATSPDDWRRVGMRNRQEVDALQLVHEAVHEGAHHLREVRTTLAHPRRAVGPASAPDQAAVPPPVLR